LPASFNGAINTDGTFNVSLRSTLFVSGTTILNNITTINSSLNVSGLTTLNIVNIQGNLNVSGTTTIIDTVINNTSFNSLSVSGPSIYYSNISCNSSLNVSGTTRLNNVTCNSSLNVSGTTILNNFTTINAPLYINTNQYTSLSALSINSISTGVLVNIIQNLGWNDGVNYALNVTGYSMFGGIQINGQDTNNIYKRVGDLTIASPLSNSIILKTNYGAWEAMRLNTAGTSISTSLYVSGLTILNNITTCTSSLNVSGIQGHAARAQSGGRRRDHLYNLIVRHARRSNPRARESHGPPPSRSHCAPPRAGAGISAL